jgi:hypothetical protein
MHGLEECRLAGRIRLRLCAAKARWLGTGDGLRHPGVRESDRAELGVEAQA